MKRLDGKVAIITGASAGIGKATSELFAEHGAKIVAVGRNADRLAALAAELSTQTEVITVQAEALNRDHTRNVFARALEAFGTVDILVNNAGIADKHRPALRTPDEFWDEVIGIDLTSVFHYCKDALEIMVKNGSGAIVNVSSIGGVYANSGVAYSTAKAGEIAMTRNIALQYAGTEIRCNAIAPGPTPTELNTPEMIATFDQEFMEICGRHTDMSVGFSDARDQANAILFLASDDARCITGQTIVVDRGMCL